MINVTKSDLPPLEKYIEYLRKIWANGWLTNDGELVQSLAKRLEEYLKVNNIMLVSNGTLAMHLVIRALGIKGEIITTPYTFAATTNVILWEGATPVFADIDPVTFNIDPDSVKKKITKKTTAIFAVHVYGNPCYVKELQEIADEHNLKLVYDAAHAFGVEYDNTSLLNYGDVSTLSFHATKVFNTIEGGAIVSKDEELLEKVKLLRNHGIKSEEEIVIPGTNAKMNEFQAAMGLCNIENIEEKIQSRRERYERYVEKLGKIAEIQFQKIISSKYNYSYMPVCLKSTEVRDKIYSKLIESGIKPRKYFFPLTVDFDYFRNHEKFVQKSHLQNAIQISNRILCLPLYPNLEMSTVDRIVAIVKKEHAYNLSYLVSNEVESQNEETYAEQLFG